MRDVAASVRRPGRRRPIGLALAGGGPLGGIYEIGALAALGEALRGVDFNDVDVYVGVSAGSFVAAGLANGFTPIQMARLFIEGAGDDRFDPATLLRPALREFARRLVTLPGLVAEVAWQAATHPADPLTAIQQLGRAIPTGLFDGDAIDRYLRRVFTAPGRSNDFRHLKRRLFLVATDLDTGAAVAFGSPGLDHVPVSRAVQASAALPGWFPPVGIGGRYFVDGALRKTLHASVALDAGVELLFCLNPLVPYDATLVRRPPRGARRAAAQRMRSLVEGGLPVVLAQTFRSLIHSRLDVGMAKYRIAYPHADIVLFEPARSDAEIFFTNMFSLGSRRALCEHAYHRTRAELLARRHELEPTLAAHGIEIDVDVLRDDHRSLVTRPRRIDRPGVRAARRLQATLDDLDRWMHARGTVRRDAAGPVIS